MPYAVQLGEAATIGPQSEWSGIGPDREVKGHDALAS
jgi:hypothetical protein